MAIYDSLIKSSSALQSAIATLAATNVTAAADAPWDDLSTATVLKRLALGTSLFFAVPLELRDAANMPNGSKNVDPLARYQHFEKYYLAGDLDPAFPVLSAWELSHTVDTDALDEDMVWLRASFAVSTAFSWA
jgi:hypothetical protein